MNRRAASALGVLAAFAACSAPPTEPVVEGGDGLLAARVQVSPLTHERPRCEGVPATLWAGMPADAVPEGAVVGERQHGGGFHIRGTPGRDVIVGSAGPDRLRGEEGNDLICAGGGDLVWGGPGNDHIVAVGEATLRGGEGNDRLIGRGGSQRMHGGPGNDVLQAGADDDVLLGGPESDALSGGAGADFIGGCDGHDVAQDFELAFDRTNGTVEVGIPEGAMHSDVPHDDSGCDGDDDGGCDGGDHDDGGCDGGGEEHDDGGCDGTGGCVGD